MSNRRLVALLLVVAVVTIFLLNIPSRSTHWSGVDGVRDGGQFQSSVAGNVRSLTNRLDQTKQSIDQLKPATAVPDTTPKPSLPAAPAFAVNQPEDRESSPVQAPLALAEKGGQVAEPSQESVGDDVSLADVRTNAVDSSRNNLDKDASLASGAVPASEEAKEKAEDSPATAMQWAQNGLARAVKNEARYPSEPVGNRLETVARLRKSHAVEKNKLRPAQIKESPNRRQTIPLVAPPAKQKSQKTQPEQKAGLYDRNSPPALDFLAGGKQDYPTDVRAQTPAPIVSAKVRELQAAKADKKALDQRQSGSSLAGVERDEGAPVGTGGGEKEARAVAADPERLAAQNFLAKNHALENLTFKEAEGYWANTYVPGDPTMRLLGGRLGDWNRKSLGLADHSLERRVRGNWQPFDPPGNSALALYLQADRASLSGGGRMLVQVGLKGIKRLSGRRPAMDVVLLLDLHHEHSAEDDNLAYALMQALERSRQSGDRFAIVVASPDRGGLLVGSDAMRYGPLQLAIKRLFGAEPNGANKSQALDLPGALTLARQLTKGGGQPEATLGTGLILLATPAASLAKDLPQLKEIAHKSALAGIATSVVALGGRVNLAEVDDLVLAGQGNRRILHGAVDALSLMDRELLSASRAVARAVRLRIRLAAKVKLVDVLGSYRLDNPAAERVRAAEQSVDRQVAHQFSIQADRGQDEEGIQIVIPTFHANADHVVLLDLVAENPGPVVDVTVRYKDMVYLKNGVARAELTIKSGEMPLGPLQKNVLKNRLGFAFAQAGQRAGGYLAAGHYPQAEAELVAMSRLLRGMRQEIPGWREDPELLQDEEILAEYLTALRLPRQAEPQRMLADSLRYVAFRKLVEVVE